jgi:hypothetical protein
MKASARLTIFAILAGILPGCGSSTPPAPVPPVTSARPPPFDTLVHEDGGSGASTPLVPNDSPPAR